MLSTRLVFRPLDGAGLLLALCVDEWLAPWFPFWFILAGVAIVAAARELIGLLDATSARPSANSVIGGVLAFLVANWLPHVADQPDPPMSVSALMLRPARPLNALAWPFLCFAVVLMVSFVVQSLQFEKPGRTMAKIAGTILGVAYVGLLGSFHDPAALVRGAATRGWSPWCSWSRRPRGPTPAPTPSAGSPAGTSSGPR